MFVLNRSEKDWEAPNGPISNDRHDLVMGLLDSATAAKILPASVVIELDADNRVQARLAGHTTPIEPSLLPILRAAAVVASNAYDEHSLVLMAVEVAPTDASRRPLLWNLLNFDPVDLNINGSGTTIVPILGASLDPQTDYMRTPPIRYVIRWDRVLRRSTESQDIAVTRIAAVNDRPLVLFLGAGASASSDIPLGNHYRDVALEDLVGQSTDKTVAAEKLFDLLHDRGHLLAGEDSLDGFVETLTLERVLLETFNQLGFRPRTDAPVIQEIINDCDTALGYVRPGRKALRQLAKDLPGRLIVMTVNFDRLIEDGLPVDHSLFFRPEDYTDSTKVADLISYAKGDSSKPMPILKLHGSIVDPDSLIATIDTTSAGLHDDVLAVLNQLLDETDKPLRWVWVGCSMRDRDMNRWLGGLGANALDEWWVDPLPGASLDSFFDEQRSPRWSPLGMTLQDRLIIDSADGFLRKLSDEVGGI
ncbi:SIR2 family protein [Aeromicrobium sp. Leaf245]|uniref:SIR2 family protein n=1 Tax=Aeromicrobium sp. Leaf245 TaxID=1736306 RepID=UPI00138F5157|nr:SIR2 family protein [Aeromicrobium sp. Leaf245]